MGTQQLKWAKNWLGISDEYKPDPKAEERRTQKRKLDRTAADNADKQERQRKISYAETLVNGAIPLAGTSGEAYLCSRAITTTLPNCILYSPSPTALLLIATSFTLVVVVYLVTQTALKPVAKLFGTFGKPRSTVFRWKRPLRTARL